MQIKIIGHIHTDFVEKFGIPRQSGLIKELTGTIEFDPPYNNPDYIKGLEGFSHLWILWIFDVPHDKNAKATVRPPRMGGNTHIGVFATRSPFRPNPIGLSCVEIKEIEYTKKGPLLHVLGADLKDGTKIIDIKPYLPYADAYPDAKGGFGKEHLSHSLKVDVSEEILSVLPKDKRLALLKVLSEDPRPAYQDDPEREYGLSFAGYEIKFTVDKELLTISSISKGTTV